MNTQELAYKWDELDFTIHTNIVYHNRRRKFFDTMHTVASFIIVLASSGAVLTLLQSTEDPNPMVTATLALLVTIVSSLDLVIGTARKARVHEMLFRSYTDLHTRQLKIPSPTEKNYLEINTDLLQIGKDEPPENRTLLFISFNEVCVATGRDDGVVAIPWWQRLIAQFFDVRELRETIIKQPAITTKQ